MKKISFMKVALVVLVILYFVIWIIRMYLSPNNKYWYCKIIVSGSYEYDIKMDDYTYYDNEPAGTYYITDISSGYHTFEAVDSDGASWGSDSETKYISSGTTTTIYLNPTQTVSTGTVYIYMFMVIGNMT